MEETEQSFSEFIFPAMNFNQLFFTEVERGIDYTQNESEKQFLRSEEVCLKSLFKKREASYLGD